MKYISPALDIMDYQGEKQSELISKDGIVFYRLTIDVYAWILQSVRIARKAAKRGKVSPEVLEGIETRLRALQALEMAWDETELAAAMAKTQELPEGVPLPVGLPHPDEAKADAELDAVLKHLNSIGKVVAWKPSRVGVVAEYRTVVKSYRVSGDPLLWEARAAVESLVTRWGVGKAVAVEAVAVEVVCQDRQEGGLLTLTGPPGEAAGTPTATPTASVGAASEEKVAVEVLTATTAVLLSQPSQPTVEAVKAAQQLELFS